MKYVLILSMLISVALGFYQQKQNKPQTDVVLAEFEQEYSDYEKQIEAEKKRVQRENEQKNKMLLLVNPYGKKDIHIKLAIVETFIPYGEENARIGLVVAKNESGFRLNAKGYNCYYSIDGQVRPAKTDPTDLSRACRHDDRAYAWSVDCGLYQINTAGQECPEELMTLEGNLQAAMGKFLGRKKTWWAWVAYQKLFN